MAPEKRKGGDEDICDLPFKLKWKSLEKRSFMEKSLRSLLKTTNHVTPQNISNSKNDKQKDINEAESMKTRADFTKCEFCSQDLSSVILKEPLILSPISEADICQKGHLSLVDDKENHKAHPYMNLTDFSVFDSNMHLCALDGGLLELGVELYFSGYLKNITDTSPILDEYSVAVENVGPIVEWCFIGYDGGKTNCITISTDIGDYNILKPSQDYKPFMKNLYEKSALSKIIVEYAEKNEHLKPTYDDLLAHILNSSIVELNNKNITEELLKKHSSFICNQIMEIKTDDEEGNIIMLPCLKEMIKKFDVKLEQSDIQPQKIKTYKNYKKMGKAVTTPRVQKIFSKIFPRHIKNLKKRKNDKCGICDTCQKPDCGMCDACKVMLKFGGTEVEGTCIHKVCSHLKQSEKQKHLKQRVSANRTIDGIFANLTKINYSKYRSICWISEPVGKINDKEYYLKVEIENFVVNVGDFVLVRGASDLPPEVTKIQYIWRDNNNPDKGYFHGQTFYRSCDTLLGEVGEPREIFMTHSCYPKVSLTFISQPVKVKKMDLFNTQQPEPNDGKVKGLTLYYQKLYNKENARFEDIPQDPIGSTDAGCINYCPSCSRRLSFYNQRLLKSIKPIESCGETIDHRTCYTCDSFEFDGTVYKVGTGIFLKPRIFNLSNYLNTQNKSKKEAKSTIDESIFTEHYRKKFDFIRESNSNNPTPYCVGFIEVIRLLGDIDLINPYDVFIQVRVMYRPENIPILNDLYNFDTNLVYWSNESREVSILDITGACELFFIKNIPNNLTLDEWSSQNPNRFYFKEAYNKAENCLCDVSDDAKRIGYLKNSASNRDLGGIRWKGKGRGKGLSNQHNFPETDKIKPLKSMDIFAGCGGLSEGLRQSGVAISHWAVENSPSAAHAYQLNNIDCCVFEDDCNSILSSILSGDEESKDGFTLPKRGEIELLCAGPPCQGFSAMNRFLNRDYSKFKNSLIATALSFCDHFRPKYFILENVRNFAAYKGGMILKMTMSCLVQMGYQCTFGVLQAGNFGLPQSRRRLFIIAAAPGLKLPQYPKPTHVFNNRNSPLSITIDQVTFQSNYHWDDSAPRRTCTIYDAISDLPPIENTYKRIVLDYGSEPKTNFQRIVRNHTENARLREHICKFMPYLVMQRIVRIPKTPGSDWRDLPNINLTLTDGTHISTLKYTHESSQGSVPNALVRGVCSCAEGRPCDPADRQRKTLIPWGMVHSADRNNSWAGSYGRLDWEGYFSTTITDPEPSGKQGRVLHPEQDRVISIRESARSQGFPDSFQFSGSVQNKYQQIGNAVPPPLAAAIGREIKQSLEESYAS